MSSARTCLLLSLKPSFAEAIFAGRKRIELRRTRPKLQPGDLVLVYVTAPRKELQGLLRVVCVAEAEPEVFWSEVSEIAGIGKEHFDRYFTGARSAFGIHFDQVHSFARPLGADEVRQNGWACFQGPQSYRYLRDHEIAILETLLDAGLWEHVSVVPAPPDTVPAEVLKCTHITRVSLRGYGLLCHSRQRNRSSAKIYLLENPCGSAVQYQNSWDSSG